MSAPRVNLQKIAFFFSEVKEVIYLQELGAKGFRSDWKFEKMETLDHLSLISRNVSFLDRTMR